MDGPPVALHTIGQTPRPDLVASVVERLGRVRPAVRGALDGIDADAVPAHAPGGYPLETRLRDGRWVVVDAAYLAPRLQASISELDHEVEAHLLLCAGPFPELEACRPLVVPWTACAEELERRGCRLLDVVVPFGGQADPAARKWAAAGFACRVHAESDRPAAVPLPAWLAARCGGDAVVLDYVGFPGEILDAVTFAVASPVFDVGRMGVDALARLLRGSRS